MLDPKEQKKGGFGAFAARQRERAVAPDTNATDATDATDATAPAPDLTPDVTPAAPGDGAATDPAAAEPHRQRFFRSML